MYLMGDSFIVCYVALRGINYAEKGTLHWAPQYRRSALTPTRAAEKMLNEQKQRRNGYRPTERDEKGEGKSK